MTSIWACWGVVGAVDGLFFPCFDKKLSPLRALLELLTLFKLAVSERTGTDVKNFDDPGGAVKMRGLCGVRGLSGGDESSE